MSDKLAKVLNKGRQPGDISIVTDKFINVAMHIIAPSPRV